jgi:prepilin-type N-terminal cleavage/methylation domain-containing protein
MKIKKSFFSAFKKGLARTDLSRGGLARIVVRRGGFTLVELLIVIGVTAILAGMVAPVYGGLQASAQIGDVSSSLVQNLRMARQKSISGFHGDSFGVRLNKPTANQYVVYQGPDYNGRISTYDETVTFGNAVSVLAPSGEDIHFTKGSGTTTAGTITITHITQGSKSMTVSVDGFIEE